MRKGAAADSEFGRGGHVPKVPTPSANPPLPMDL